jgi:anaerobic magnesium-protoporphyrin IX monomethyl ester cyclase
MQNNTVILTTITLKQKYYQLGLHYLKTFAQKYGKDIPLLKIDIHIISPNKFIFDRGEYWPIFSNSFILDHASILVKDNPRVIGFSCFSWNIDVILKIIKIIKKQKPDVYIILGGPEATSHPEKLLKNNSFIDAIARDEGEETFSELLHSIFLNKLAIDQIKGLTYRNRDYICKNLDREPIDLKRIPSPYSYPLRKYDLETTFTVETSRGCPFNCAYCTYSIRSNHGLRFHPIEKVKKELKYLLKKNIYAIWINDDNFNINPKRAKDLLTYISKYKKNTKIKLFLNASQWPIDDMLIQLLRKVDATALIGVQTINVQTLKRIQRKTDFSILTRNLNEFDKYKLNYCLEFIAGLPGDTYQDVLNTINWASKFNADRIQLFLLMVYPGTFLYDHAKEWGISYNTRNLFSPFLLRTRELKKKEMIKLMKIINGLELLYNNKLLRKTLELLIRKDQIQLTDILEEWNKRIKFLVRDKSYVRKLYFEFFNKIKCKYNITTSLCELDKMIVSDIKAYRSN